MDQSEFRKLFKKFMIQESKSLKERFDNDDEDLGIYSADFDPNEFSGDAMKAAMKDIGSEFEPLGKSKFEKNLDLDDFIADLQRQNLNLPKDKEELSGIKKMMNTKKAHEKKFGAGSLNETGEWSDDEEGAAWIESLRGELEMIENMLSPGLPFIIRDVKGFDKYQGPYAIVEISGDVYKVWTQEGNELWIEDFPIDNTSSEGSRPGFMGNAEEIADVINQQYSILAHMNEESEDRINTNSKIDRPKDSEGQPITLKARVEDVDTGTIGHVVRFGVDDNSNQTVHVNWMYSFGDAIVKPVTYPNKIVVRDKTRIVREEKEEEEEEAYSNNRYMFFANLQQIHRQSGLMLKMNEEQVNGILEGGHDWAQDHIATAKESMDQVFDFLMNETKKEGTLDEIENIASEKESFEIGDTVSYPGSMYDKWEVTNVVGPNKIGQTFIIISAIQSDGSHGVKTTVHPSKISKYPELKENLTGEKQAEKIFAKIQEEINYLIYKSHINQEEAGDKERIDALYKELDVIDGGENFDFDYLRKYTNALAAQRKDAGYLEFSKQSELEFDKGFNDEMDESMIRSHANGRGQNLKPGNYPQTLKRVGLKEGVLDKIKSTIKGISPEQIQYNKTHGLPTDWKGSKEGYHEFVTNKKHSSGTNENLDQAIDVDDEVFFVVDNDFNRAHYKDLIGQTFADAPGYAQVKLVKKNEKPVAEDFDYAAAEIEHAGQEELKPLESEAMQVVPENLIQFLDQNSFTTEGGGYSFILKIPKQANELLKDIELFVREEIGIDKQINLYTVLEKVSNKWIIDVKVIG